MTNKQLHLIKETLLKQKKDIEDLYNIEINNDSEEGDEIDLAIKSNIIDIEDKKIKQHKKYLNEIETALKKIENNNYGICEESGEEIPFQRLIANPIARYSIEVQSLIEANKR